jgi:hypothetical protein
MIDRQDLDLDDELDHRKKVEAERKRKFDEELDRGLEGSFPGSDPVSVTQPPPSARDKHKP